MRIGQHCIYIQGTKRLRSEHTGGNIAIYKHIPAGNQGYIPLIARDCCLIILSLQRRINLNMACIIPVYCHNIALHGWLHSQREGICRSAHKNITRKRCIGYSALHRNGLERIARALQVNRLGTDSCDLAGLDTGISSLIDICRNRAKFHILACRKGRIGRLPQCSLRTKGNTPRSRKVASISQCAVPAKIMHRDIACHLPLDCHHQCRIIIFDAHIPVNSRLFCRSGFNAINGEAAKLISCILQQQRFAIDGLDRPGSNRSLVRLGDIAIDSLQRQIACLHSAV